ncbi:MAG: hypothetical protein ACT6RN_27460 [Agrobacterium sp.]|uniref:hypothetical protein n=1 Tax=Agrobacterium sp. TaxID=361 RepID=UPI00403784C1
MAALLPAIEGVEKGTSPVPYGALGSSLERSIKMNYNKVIVHFNGSFQGEAWGPLPQVGARGPRPPFCGFFYEGNEVVEAGGVEENIGRQKSQRKKESAND